MWPLILLWFTQAADILTTIWGQHLGYVESNVVASHQAVLVIFLKLFTLTLASALWFLAPRWRRLIGAGFLIATGATIYVVCQNLLHLTG